MPTGYTDTIRDGISFKEYALGCAKAFGALMSLRDEPSDTKIPNKIEPSDFYTKRLREFKSKLLKIKSLNKQEALVEAENEFNSNCEKRNLRIKENLTLKKQYKNMLSQAIEYQPPSTDHFEYKKFMISQIEDSIRFDCEYSQENHPVLLAGEVWKAQTIKQLLSDIEYYEKENLKEIERANKQTKWIQQLLKSLPE